MIGTKMKSLLGLLFLLSLIGYAGCILSPADEPLPPKPIEEYGDLTVKDHVIRNFVKSYNETNIDEFTKILHDDYMWFNQTADVDGGAKPFNTRDEDVAMTGNMFQAKLGTHPDPALRIDKLELKLYNASWQPKTELEGNPCDDCWETTREYYLTVVMGGGDMTYIGNDKVRLIVVPIMKDGTKYYRLFRMEDLPK